ncbi:ABC transporter ATP-binding protein [Tuwongella immobilis]|uniref:ABC transporter domain-containing protein n=1 Tax=Tuwongella immobilis TaxID=692036 RepID=A0A6C2YR77_9BACT|nr:ABC transporter ATP-binding protein [Tuwongella immobilis]VIP04150.1 abc transporter-like protein : ABC transporter related protein OS=Isosphaera pallida (strain ATCC 43644 / DSM 9630 / IS1B) GN=Isop_2111 PE=4 SV=1: ABC_tran [Tuwongella immobilis]VTS05665.1 abc transporter-like protein : ABC transporter related protein OS=Isosphaera pallida (strain ATCC 43644 / DSM 9630 / IS1B) GN=Isop_2111 PE=4 SV=1: ABC_tran [Tuwongella immobilis]
MSQPADDFLIDLQQITRRYGEFVALREVTLQLPPGRIGLLGPNGAGKSSLLKLLMGLLPATSGSGKILGQTLQIGEIKEANWELRRMIGFMPEADALVPGLRGVDYVTLAGELYGMPRRQAQRRAHEVLTYLELEDARYRNLETYSTGMKQRLKLAQALVHDPPMLLLDEPTSGLDPASRDTMLRLLLELGRDHGKSMLLSTHLLADVERVCERVVILFNGEVRGQGTVEELCARRQDRYRISVHGDATQFRQALQRQQVTILPDSSPLDLRVLVPPQWSNRQFFTLAAESGVVLRQMQRDDETLEELFLRSVAADKDLATSDAARRG